MGNHAKAMGAHGRQEAFLFYPNDLTLIVGDPDPQIVQLASDGYLSIERDTGHYLYDKRADMPPDESLARSLQTDGCIQNLRITRDGDRKLVVTGRQRVKAAALANKLIGDPGSFLRLPCAVYRGNEAKSFRAMLVENEQRVGDPPTLRAEKMASAIDRGWSTEEVCDVFRVGKQQLSNMLKLLDCAPEVRNEVDAGVITPTLAYTKIARLDRKEQVKAVKELKAAGVTRGAAASEAVETRRNGKNNGGTKPPKAKPRAPKRTDIENWISKLKDYDDAKLEGVRMGLMKAIGMSPKGWSEVKAVLEMEE